MLASQLKKKKETEKTNEVFCCHSNNIMPLKTAKIIPLVQYIIKQ